MKFCKAPFNEIHMDPGGRIRCCGWNDANLGNLVEQDLEEIWHGEAAKKVRESIINGSYEYCRAVSCPFLENDTLPDFSEDEMRNQAIVSDMPEEYSVACDFTCNHSCPSCREQVFSPDEEYRQNLKIELEKVLPYLNQGAKRILTCGNGDFFSSRQMMELLEKLHPQNPDCKISFETNGTLFNRKNWERIRHLGEFDLSVTITPNSYEERTFKYLNGGHNTYKNLLDNLRFVKELRQKSIVNFYEISIVVQERNFDELPEFTKRSLQEFSCDKVVVKPLYHWFGMSEENYWFKDVWNPLHPYHEELIEILKNPIFEDDRVFFWGGHHMHQPMKHPAYRYKDNLLLIKKMSENPEFHNKVKLYCRQKKIEELYLYGDTEVTPIIYHFLKNDIRIKGIVARDFGEESYDGLKKIQLSEFKDIEVPLLLINYHFADRIQRDLDFFDIEAKYFKLNEMLEEVCQ